MINYKLSLISLHICEKTVIPNSASGRDCVFCGWATLHGVRSHELDLGQDVKNVLNEKMRCIKQYHPLLFSFLLKIYVYLHVFAVQDYTHGRGFHITFT